MGWMHHLPGSAQAAPAPTSRASGECHKTSNPASADSFRHCALPTERARAGPSRYFSTFLGGGCWRNPAPGSPPGRAARTASPHRGRPLAPPLAPPLCVWRSHRSDCVCLIYSTKEALSAAPLRFLGSPA